MFCEKAFDTDTLNLLRKKSVFTAVWGDGCEIKHLTGLSPWAKNPPSERHHLQEARLQDETVFPRGVRAESILRVIRMTEKKGHFEGQCVRRTVVFLFCFMICWSEKKS